MRRGKVGGAGKKCLTTALSFYCSMKLEHKMRQKKKWEEGEAKKKVGRGEAGGVEKNVLLQH